MMKKILLFVCLLLVGAILVFAGLSDKIRVEIMGGNSVVVTNYNDVPVTVSLSIEYLEKDSSRFEHMTLSLGRSGFSNDSAFWGLRGIQIIDVKINSVK